MLRFIHVFFYRLLDVLAGRKDPAGLRGTLLLDGSPPPENFKCMVGYVVQVCSYRNLLCKWRHDKQFRTCQSLCVNLYEYNLMIYIISKATYIFVLIVQLLTPLPRRYISCSLLFKINS
jgi:hypothetical protein